MRRLGPARTLDAAEFSARVPMGRGLVRDPLLFLFDEPLSNVDADLRVDMCTEIKHLQQRIATVYVTHNQIEAVMNQGEIQQFDSPDTVYNRLANVFVARFLGSPPMNAVPACHARQGWRLVGIGAGRPDELRLALPQLRARAATRAGSACSTRDRTAHWRRPTEPLLSPR
jgi:ABC-type sugar transport system ATPase subunit